MIISEGHESEDFLPVHYIFISKDSLESLKNSRAFVFLNELALVVSWSARLPFKAGRPGFNPWLHGPLLKVLK